MSNTQDKIEALKRGHILENEKGETFSFSGGVFELCGIAQLASSQQLFSSGYRTGSSAEYEETAFPSWDESPRWAGRW